MVNSPTYMSNVNNILANKNKISNESAHTYFWTLSTFSKTGFCSYLRKLHFGEMQPDINRCLASVSPCYILYIFFLSKWTFTYSFVCHITNRMHDARPFRVTWEMWNSFSLFFFYFIFLDQLQFELMEWHRKKVERICQLTE